MRIKSMKEFCVSGFTEQISVVLFMFAFLATCDVLIRKSIITCLKICCNCKNIFFNLSFVTR